MSWLEYLTYLVAGFCEKYTCRTRAALGARRSAKQLNLKTLAHPHLQDDVPSWARVRQHPGHIQNAVCGEGSCSGVDRGRRYRRSVVAEPESEGEQRRRRLGHVGLGVWSSTRLRQRKREQKGDVTSITQGNPPIPYRACLKVRVRRAPVSTDASDPVGGQAPRRVDRPRQDGEQRIAALLARPPSGQQRRDATQQRVVGARRSKRPCSSGRSSGQLQCRSSASGRSAGGQLQCRSSASGRSAGGQLQCRSSASGRSAGGYRPAPKVAGLP
jgi:hypothetical protein